MTASDPSGHRYIESGDGSRITAASENVNPNNTGLPTLCEGDSGTMVARLQSTLNAFGASLATDGQFGPKTDAAVRCFQSDHGLSVDGIVGPKTWTVLLSGGTTANSTETQTAPVTNGAATNGAAAAAAASNNASTIDNIVTNSVNVLSSTTAAGSGVAGYAGVKSINNFDKQLDISSDITEKSCSDFIGWSDSVGERINNIGYVAVAVDTGIGAYSDYNQGYRGSKIAYDAVVNATLDAGTIYASGAIGAAIGTAIPVPGLGTAVGFLVGMGIGYGISYFTNDAKFINNKSLRQNVMDLYK